MSDENKWRARADDLASRLADATKSFRLEVEDLRAERDAALAREKRLRDVLEQLVVNADIENDNQPDGTAIEARDLLAELYPDSPGGPT